MEKVSCVDVIMPNYNKGKYLEEAINSVISQKFKNWNLFIIDNFSQDNSKKVLDKFNDKFKNIKVIYLSKNKGVGFSRNLGIRLSKGDYISFIDSDDYWLPNKLQDQILFMNNFNHDFTYSDYTTFVLKNDRKVIKNKIISPNSFTFNQFINNTSMATSSIIIKRSYVGTTRFPKIETFEDYSFKCKLLKKGNKAVKINKNSMYYRITKKSLSSNKLKSLYWLWYINKKYNKLSFIRNFISVSSISISSIKKYGFK